MINTLMDTFKATIDGKKNVIQISLANNGVLAGVFTTYVFGQKAVFPIVGHYYNSTGKDAYLFNMSGLSIVPNTKKKKPIPNVLTTIHTLTGYMERNASNANLVVGVSWAGDVPNISPTQFAGQYTNVPFIR